MGTATRVGARVQVSVLEPQQGTIEYGGLPLGVITRADVGLCVLPTRYAPALSAGNTVDATSSRRTNATRCASKRVGQVAFAV
jgi:hypothetical protein